MRKSLPMALAMSLAVVGSNCSAPSAPDSGTPPPVDAGDTTPVLDVTQCTLTVDRPTGVTADGTDRATITVVVKDSRGNPMAGQSVVLDASGTQNTLTQPAGPTDASGKALAFIASAKAETKTIRATVASSPLPATATVKFVAGMAAKLSFFVQPTSAGTGSAIAPAVQVAVTDVGGNVVADSTLNVSVSLGNNSTGATLAGTRTVAAAAGYALFNDLSVDKLGTGYALIASAPGLANVTSSPFDVTAGAAAKLAFTVHPSNVAAGASITPAVEVTVQDRFGNPVRSATDVVTLALAANPGNATLGGTLAVPAVNGVASFSTLSLDKTGQGFTLTASAPGLTAATSAAFNVTAGQASKLAFTVEPSNGSVGIDETPSVEVTIEDALGNKIPSAGNAISLALGTNPSGATLTGGAAQTPAQGVATFANLRLSQPGTGYTLVASAQGLTSATSTAFDVAVVSGAQLVFTVQPTDVVAGASITPGVQVTMQDSGGNVVTTFNGTITVGLGTNTGGATLSGTRTVGAASGVATFPDLSLDRVATGYTLRASAAGALPATSAVFRVNAGPPAKLAIVAQPTNVAAGASIAPAVQVAVQDALGNVVTSASTAVSLAIDTNPGAATLGGTTSASPAAGLASFPSLTLNKVGVGYTLRASCSGLTGVVSAAFNVTPGAAAQLAFTTQPTAVTAGASLTPAVAVAVQDSFGNTVTTATDAITLSIRQNPGGATLSGTATANASGGVATFGNLSLDKAGVGYTLQATAGAMTGTSSAFDVTAASASRLAVLTQPGSTPAGASITPAVRVAVQDPFGNVVTGSTAGVTLALGTNPAGGVLSGTLSAAAVMGVASFADLRIDRPGTGYTLAASSTGLTSTTSSAFDVTVGAPAKLAFGVQPANATAGATLAPAVTVLVQDQYGNTVPTATTAVTLALAANPGSGTLSGTVTASAVNGVATFSTLSVDKAGAGYTLGATGGGLTGATSSAFTVAAGAAARLSFTVQPAGTTAGQALAPAVQVAVTDALGNAVTSATTSVTVGIGTGPGGATLSGTATVAAVMGVASFSTLSLDKAGAYTLSATAGGLSGATSASFTVAAAAPSSLAFTTQPTSAVAGAAIAPAVQVTLRDAFGNTAPVSSPVTLALAANPGPGTLSGTTTVAAVNGVATFATLSVDRAAAGYTLAASSGALPGATSSAFNVTAGTAARLAFGVQPATATAGAAIAPAVTVLVQDAFGNTVPTATTAVTLALTTNPGMGTLSGTATAPAAAGVATFSTLSIDKAAVGYVLGATGGGLAAASSAAFTVVAGPAARLRFNAVPATATAGQPLAPAVLVGITDALGNPVTSATTSVTVAIATGPAGGLLSGTATVPAVMGVATFSTLSFDKAGTYTLSATGTGLSSATSTGIAVNPGPPASLAFTVQPSTVAAGASVAPAVQVTLRDAFGNTAPVSNPVTVALGANPGLGTLSGTLTVAAVNGVASFATLSVDRAASGYTLVASSGSLAPATSAAFTVNPGPPARLAFVTQPATVAAGATLALPPQVAVQDAFGNAEPSAANTITVALAPNAYVATLGGTASVAAVTGTASFPGLSVDRVGTGYTLVATAAGLANGTSAAFNVTGAWSLAQYGGSVVGLAVHPTSPTTVWAATPNGVFKTINGGALWSLSTAGLTSQDVRAIAVDPSTPTTLYAATPGGGGGGLMFKSLDGGASWQALAGYTGGLVANLVVAPTTPTSTVWVAGTSALYRSTDNGTSWTTLALGTGGVTAVAVDAASPQTVWAAQTDFTNNVTRIYKTTTGGTGAWSVVVTLPLSGGQLPVVSGLAANGLVVWVATNSGVFRSADGSTFPLLSTTAASCVAVDSAGLAWLGAPTGAYTGTATGLTVVPFTGLTAPQVKAVAVDPLTAGTAWAGTLGAWKKTAAAMTFTETDVGLAAWSVTAMASGTLAGLASVLAGTASGIARSLDSGATWTLAPLPPVTSLVISNSGYAYAAAGGQVWQSTDGLAWQLAPQPSGSVLSLGLTASGTPTLFAGTNSSQVFSTPVPAGGWTQLGLTGLGGGPVTSVAAPPGASVVYAATPQGLYSLQGGILGIFQLVAGVPSPVNALVVDTVSSTAWVATGSQIFRGTNTTFSPVATVGGASVDYRSIAVSGGAVFAGARNAGVYALDATLGQMRAANVGIASLSVMALTATSTTTVYAGTDGRDVFKTTTGGL